MLRSPYCDFELKPLTVAVHRHKQYQWLYIAVPARLILSATVLSTMLLKPERMSGMLLCIGVADALGAIGMGRLIGFSGREPAGRMNKGH